MFANEILLGATLLLSQTAAPAGETCVAGWEDERGAPQTAPVVLALSSRDVLDRSVLPERTSGIVCHRESILPRPEDLRVLSELGVSFGILAEDDRALWIWARSGRLQTTVDNGRLNRSEAAAVRRWSADAQRRFDEILARR